MARDIRRLAASVRWIQREEIAARLRREAQRSAVSGFTGDDGGHSDHGEMFENGVSSCLLGSGSRVPPSAMSFRRNTLRAPFIVLVVSVSILIMSVFGAPITRYFAVGGWGPSSKSSSKPKMASFHSKLTTPRTYSDQESSRSMGARADDHRILAESGLKSFARATVSTLPSGPHNALRSTAIRELDPGGIMLPTSEQVMLILRGVASPENPRGQLDDQSALDYARRVGFHGEVLDVPGYASSDSEQVQMGVMLIRRDENVSAIYGFSAGGYNARLIWNQLTPAERNRIRKVVVIGSPGVAQTDFTGGAEVVIKPDPPEGHMAGPKSLLQSLGPEENHPFTTP